MLSNRMYSFVKQNKLFAWKLKVKFCISYLDHHPRLMIHCPTFFLEILAVVWPVEFVSAPSFAIVVEVVVHVVDEMAAE